MALGLAKLRRQAESIRCRFERRPACDRVGVFFLGWPKRFGDWPLRGALRLADLSERVFDSEIRFVHLIKKPFMPAKTSSVTPLGVAIATVLSVLVAAAVGLFAWTDIPSQRG
jgi:hypothetical protein